MLRPNDLVGCESEDKPDTAVDLCQASVLQRDANQQGFDTLK